MKKEEIFLSDVQRILFGQAPPEFLLEVFFRTLVMYLALLVLLRLLGNRMNAELSIIEMVIMLTLGAVVALPMQDPGKGIFQGLLVLTCTLAFHRIINWFAFKSTRFENLTQNVGTTLVIDGVLQVDEMRKTGVSHQLVLGELRSRKIYNLSRVQRLYLEGCGTFSVYKNEEKNPGLATFPMDDARIWESFDSAEGFFACNYCGTVTETKSPECQNCRKTDPWTKAIQ